MTFCTLHRCMFPRQGESCAIVAERHGRFPRVESVALLAGVVQLAPVDILVARRAFSGETQERFGGEERRVLADVGRLTKFGSMTSFTVETGVFARKGEADAAVIVGAPVKSNELERPSEMFLVAFHALTACQRTMKARPRLDPCAEFPVALQALFVDNGFAEFVARRTRADPLEGRM